MMHALEDCLSIMMYSGIHDNIMTNSCVHRNHAVRSILKEGMVVMWYERLYHSGAKSKTLPAMHGQYFSFKCYIGKIMERMIKNVCHYMMIKRIVKYKP